MVANVHLLINNEDFFFCGIMCFSYPYYTYIIKKYCVAYIHQIK